VGFGVADPRANLRLSKALAKAHFRQRFHGENSISGCAATGPMFNLQPEYDMIKRKLGASRRSA
jgi:hypothetical protein